MFPALCPVAIPSDWQLLQLTSSVANRVAQGRAWLTAEAPPDADKRNTSQKHSVTTAARHKSSPSPQEPSALHRHAAIRVIDAMAERDRLLWPGWYEEAESRYGLCNGNGAHFGTSQNGVLLVQLPLLQLPLQCAGSDCAAAVLHTCAVGHARLPLQPDDLCSK